jgi:hypothetical protein
MEGFRTCLERAIRVEDEIDWSVHTVDYVMFKRRLRVFAKRRARLRELIRASPDERIPQNVLTAILGPIAYQSPALAFLGMKAEEAKLQEDALLKSRGSDQNPSADQQDHHHPQGVIGSASGDYIQFVDSGVSSTSGSRLDHAVRSHPVLHHTMQQTTRADEVTDSAVLPAQPGSAVLPSTSSDPDQHNDLMQTSLSSSQPSDSSHCQPIPQKPQRRLKKRMVWRAVSNAERNELVLFLTWEMDKVAMFYLARWQRLSPAYCE